MRHQLKKAHISASRIGRTWRRRRSERKCQGGIDPTRAKSGRRLLEYRHLAIAGVKLGGWSISNATIGARPIKQGVVTGRHSPLDDPPIYCSRILE
jgi:hypothetical protein